LREVRGDNCCWEGLGTFKLNKLVIGSSDKLVSEMVRELLLEVRKQVERGRWGESRTINKQ